MNRWETIAKVYQRKRKYPEKYCLDPVCLYRTDERYCPRHARKIVADAMNKSIGREIQHVGKA